MSEVNTNGTIEHAADGTSKYVVPEPVAETPKKSTPKVEHGKLLYIDSGNAADFKKIVLAKDENDFDWDAKMLLPLPEGLVSDLAEHGWDESMPLRVKPEGSGYKVTQGRTKVRAVPEVNKLRAKHKLPPLLIPVLVIKGEDEIEGMRVAARLNHLQNISDPITTALTIERFFAAGLTEADVAKDLGIPVKAVLEHYELLRLPKSVQVLIKSGKMTVKAAQGLTHVDKKRVEAIAERLVEQAESVGRVTERATKAATKGDPNAPDRMNAKAVKALIDEIEGTTVAGKHGKAVQAAAVAVLETVLDARKRGKVISKLEDIASK